MTEDTNPPIKLDDDLEILPTEVNDTLVIKGKFKFQSLGIYGIFAVILRTDIQTNLDDHSEISPFLSSNIIVSYFNDIFQTDITIPWAILEQDFNSKIIKESYAVSLTNQFQKHLHDAFTSNTSLCTRILERLKENRKSSITVEFDQLLSAQYTERELQIETYCEELSSNSIKTIREQRIKQERPKDNRDILETPSIVTNPLHFSIPAEPVLAPVGQGILSDQLSCGIRILMKIDGRSSYGLEWIQSFKDTHKEKDNKHLFIVGTINQIGPTVKNRVSILVTYQTEQYTKFTVESGVKIKLYHPLEEGITVIDPLSNIGYNNNDINNITTLSQLFHEKSFQMTVVIGCCLLLLAVTAFYFSV